jgi:DNA-binding NarL/FixJ family response regulator
MSDTATIRLMVVDDQELMRDGLSAILSRQPGLNVVAVATDGEDALRQIAHIQPDVVLMDVRMPVLDGVQATVELRRCWPKVKVLMLTTFDDNATIVEALRAGAVGYVLKNIPAQDLAAAVRLAVRGVVQLDAAVAAKVAAALHSVPPGMPQQGTGISTASLTTNVQISAAETASARLTEREREVLALVASGANNREIAERLVIAEGTVKSHISNILGHLGLRDRTQIAVFAHKQGNTKAR